jgi:hypothetical protein
VAAVWLVSALLSPPLYDLVAPFFDEPPKFARIARRIAMLVGLVGLLFWLRRWRATSWAALGLPRGASGGGRFARALAVGFGVGALVLAIEAAAGAWSWSVGLAPSDVVETAIGALIVGLLEESVFRGFLLLARPPLGSAALAFRIATISLLYSAVHFARGGGPRVAPHAGSGFEVWARMPDAIAEQADAFWGLAALGLLFAALAWRDRDAWRAAGLHAGIVAGIRLGSDLLDPVAGRSGPLLADGLQPGWGALVPLLLASAWLLRGSGRR